MTNRSLNTLSRRQALTATAAVVASVAATLPASAAPGVSPELVRLREAMDAAAIVSARFDLPASHPDFDDAALDAANDKWSEAWRRFRQYPSQSVIDINYKIDTIRREFRDGRRAAWAEWADYGGDDWLGEDIARLAGKGA